MEKRIAKIFLDAKGGENFEAALDRARNEGCDFICFNDSLYPVDGSVDCGSDEAPAVSAWYLRDVYEWRMRYSDSDKPKPLTRHISMHG